MMLPSKFCFIFSLRQGTLCVAVTELTLTSFVLLLMVLGAERAQEIAAEAYADMADSPELAELIPAEDQDLLPVWANPDGPFVIHRGQELATVMMFLLYAGVVMATTHLLCCLLMLYGAVRGVPRFLLPWTLGVLLSLVMTSIFLVLFAFLPYRGCKMQIYVILVTLLVLEAHSWMVVFNFYRQLSASVSCRIISNILPSYDLDNPVRYTHVDL